jgi:glucan endo-1,3-alpha-glucosidase
VREAIAVDFDGFAMNLGNPNTNWTKSTVDQLFAAAEGTDFGLFFSFDTVQHRVLTDHFAFFEGYRDHPNYMRGGSDDLPIVSSYGGHALTADWAHFKGGYSSYSGSRRYWACSRRVGPVLYGPCGQLGEYLDIVDGFFSWESAWPRSIGGPENINSVGDEAVMSFAHEAGKAYMMGKEGIHSRQGKRLLGGLTNAYFLV